MENEERYGEFTDIKDIITQGAVQEVVNGCEFDISLSTEGTFSLTDQTGANLGNIELMEFRTEEEVLARLEDGGYLEDYGYIID